MSPIALSIALTDGPAGVVIKSTILLTCAAIAVLGLRWASAAVRHLVWMLALGSCLALAVLTPAAPSIEVGVPANGGARHPRLTAPALAVAAQPLAVAAPVRAGSNRESAVSNTLPAVPMSIGFGSPDRRSQTGAIIARYVPALLVVSWLAGCLLLLARTAIGHRRVAQIVDRATELTSEDWMTVVDAAADDVRLDRPVEVFMSDDIAAPVTVGVFRPVVILPTDCASWPTERRHIVLVHELAHVARYDYVAQLVATIACAVFWFHPGVWVAAARLRAEAEHAADDRVLGAGTQGVTYATHLLELARGDHAMRLAPSATVGMIRSSHLEGRFRAMLDSTRSRAGVSARLQAAATALSLCAMLPIAGMRVVTRERVVRTHVAQTVIQEYASTPMTAPALRPATAADIARGATPAVAAARAVSAARVVSAVRAVAALVAAPAAADSVFEQTIDAASGDQLLLDLRTGGAIILHGWDEPRVRLVATLGGPDWRDTRVSFQRISNGIRLRSEAVRTSGSSLTSHRFELWVPRRTNVDLASAGGSISINDVSGTFYGHSGGGGITIEGATGSASLSTGGGPVSVSNSNLSGSVSTGGGEVVISNVSGGLRGNSGTGSVTVSNGSTVTLGGGGSGGSGEGTAFTVGGSGGRSRGSSTNIVGGFGGTVTTNYPGELGAGFGRGEGVARAGGTFTISKAGGEIVIGSAPGGAILHTGGGRIVVGSAGGMVAASTGGGDIELEQIGTDATASTGAGDVRISVNGATGGEHSIDVYSGKGRVVLELPANLDARIELESAYTENIGRRTRITSDFPVEQSETDQWDDRFGTPRKFVRAQGTVGRGTGLIRVRTVNGDVEVRRVNR